MLSHVKGHENGEVLSLPYQKLHSTDTNDPPELTCEDVEELKSLPIGKTSRFLELYTVSRSRIGSGLTESDYSCVTSLVEHILGVAMEFGPRVSALQSVNHATYLRMDIEEMDRWFQRGFDESRNYTGEDRERLLHWLVTQSALNAYVLERELITSETPFEGPLSVKWLREYIHREEKDLSRRHQIEAKYMLAHCLSTHKDPDAIALAESILNDYWPEDYREADCSMSDVEELLVNARTNRMKEDRRENDSKDM